MYCKHHEGSCENETINDKQCWWQEEISVCDDIELKTSCNSGKSVSFAIILAEKKIGLANEHNMSQDSKAVLSSSNHDVDDEEEFDNLGDCGSESSDHLGSGGSRNGSHYNGSSSDLHDHSHVSNARF